MAAEEDGTIVIKLKELDTRLKAVEEIVKKEFKELEDMIKQMYASLGIPVKPGDR